MPRILIIEDDTDINNSTAQYLRRQGCECVQAFSGTEGRLLWQGGGMDLLLVDLMLPGLSGGELIAEIRRAGRTPVIVLSARTALSDKVELLGLGADDYLTKPYQLEELWARILVQLRHASAAPAGGLLRYRDWVLNTEEMTLTAAGQPVGLTAHEFKIVELLAGVRRGGQDHHRPHQQHPGQAAAQRHGRLHPDRVGHRVQTGRVNFALSLPFLCDVWALAC